MRIRLSLVLFVLALFAAVWGISVVSGLAAAGSGGDEEVARAVVARERASFDAWQRKDKSFFAGLLADDATYFMPANPYLEVDPRQNFLPKFEKYAEMIRYQDFEMYNPRVQVYGDTAVLTYNTSVAATIAGRPVQYTGKMTSVYVRQGGQWRVVHGHESVNPGGQH